MTNPHTPGPDRIIVFGRYPVPGRTKTRLIPHLGPTAAADLQRRLTERTLATSKRLASCLDVGLEVCLEGGSRQQILRWLGSDLLFARQVEGDLGERMGSAFLNAFRAGCRRVVLIGTDIPEMKPSHLWKAFDALVHKDLVLGPSTDGGYWLMGLRRFVDLFQDVPWGTGEVLDRTVSLAKAKGLKICRLNPLRDMDTVEDLKRWRPDEAAGGPYISVIIPTLNEAARIESTLSALRNEEVEVTVVDGGSTDDTVRLAAQAGAGIEKSARGRAVQLNRGAELARGRVLLFLHADTLLPNGYLDHVFETLMDAGTTLGAFRFKTDLDSPGMRLIEFLTNFRARILKLPYGDQALFIRKPDFESLGGFPEVPIAEDLFFVRKLSGRGNISVAPAEAVTSGRRWKTLGLLRTTMLNQIIVAGCYLGLPPHVLASLYRIPRRKGRSD